MEDNKTEIVKGYFQVPKSLFYLRREGKLSLTAFDIYLLMSDRYKLSVENNWKDKEGNYYIQYSYDGLLEQLSMTNRRVISKALKELKKLELIKSKRRFNASTVYYIKKLINESVQDVTSVQKDTSDSVQKDTSESVLKVHSNKNNINKNNINKNNYIEVDAFPESKVANNKGAYLQTITLYCSGLDVNPKALVKLGKTLDRIKEVTKFGRENNWKGSWIYAAIRDDTDLTKIKSKKGTTEEFTGDKYKEEIEETKRLYKELGLN